MTHQEQGWTWALLWEPPLRLRSNTQAWGLRQDALRQDWQQITVPHRAKEGAWGRVQQKADRPCPSEGLWA